MKKRLLMVVPVLALLGSCGSDPLAGVRQSLPEDVEQIPTPSDEKETQAMYQLVDDAIDGVLNFSSVKSSYHLAVDVTYDVSGEAGRYGVSGGASVKGDLYVGYEMTYVDGVPSSSLFVKLEDFSMSYRANLPKEIKEEYPIPENLTLEHVNLFAYITETDDGTIAYLDLSDHALQDCVYTALDLAGLPKESTAEVTGYEEYLDSFLGKKDKTTGYRPGKVQFDFSSLLTDIDNLMAAKEGEDYEHAPKDLIQKPVSYALSMLNYSIEQISSKMGGIGQMLLAVGNPSIGTKTVESTVTQTSMVFSVSTAQLAEQMQISEEYFPVHGVAGLLISVGTETGATKAALQEIKLAANMSGNIEGMDMSVNGLIDLTASYNDQATILSVSSPATYVDITSAIHGMFNLK